MSDNKNKTSQQYGIRVDANDSSEVEYLHQRYPSFTHQQILDVIKEKGPLHADVVAYLNKMK
ncbi:hypothetical protein BH10BAC2_BH10BAC2_35380 [soil metagenome]